MVDPCRFPLTLARGSIRPSSHRHVQSVGDPCRFGRMRDFLMSANFLAFRTRCQMSEYLVAFACNLRHVRRILLCTQVSHLRCVSGSYTSHTILEDSACDLEIPDWHVERKFECNISPSCNILSRFPICKRLLVWALHMSEHVFRFSAKAPCAS